ncbi:MAG: DUF2508 family protein [Oscillospiraceae bacterium]|nr:DUF2508 family protein [Oscillospiraceae bacterium]
MEKTIEKKSTLHEKLTQVLNLFTKRKEKDGDFERQALLSDIEAALTDIRHARNCFEEARDPEMIEACIFEIKSAEARYSFLIRKAKLMSLKI